MDISIKISGITLGNQQEQVQLDDVEFKLEKVTSEDIKSFFETVPQFIHHLAGSIEDFSETIAYAKEMLGEAGLEEMLAGLKQEMEQPQTEAQTFKFTAEPKQEEKQEDVHPIAAILAEIEKQVADLAKEQESKGATGTSPFGLPKLSPEDEQLFYKIFGNK